MGVFCKVRGNVVGFKGRKMQRERRKTQAIGGRVRLNMRGDEITGDGGS